MGIETARLTDIRLEQWRTMPAVHMAPVARVNVLTGRNGTGKTTLLRAIGTLLREGTAEERALGPPRLRLRRESGTTLEAIEAEVSCEPDREPGSRGPLHVIVQPMNAEEWQRRLRWAGKSAREQLERAIAETAELNGTGKHGQDAAAWAREAGDGERVMAETLWGCESAGLGTLIADGIDGAVHADVLERWWKRLMERAGKHRTQVMWATHRRSSVGAAARAARETGVDCAVQSLERRDSGAGRCATYRGTTLEAAIEIGLALT